MTDQIPYGRVEFVDNPEPRVACVLLLDVSGSMSGDRIEELNAALVTFKDALAADTLASKRAEIAIITFGGAVQVAQDFVTAAHFEPTMLKAGGDTPMGQAIERGLDLVNERKQVYKDNGIAFYRPWIFLITDGAPTDGWQSAANRVRQGHSARAFTFFAVGVEDAEMETLKAISVRDPLKLRGLEFRELFLWLSRSMQSVSHSSTGDENVPLEVPTWGAAY